MRRMVVLPLLCLSVLAGCGRSADSSRDDAQDAQARQAASRAIAAAQRYYAAHDRKYRGFNVAQLQLSEPDLNPTRECTRARGYDVEGQPLSPASLTPGPTANPRCVVIAWETGGYPVRVETMMICSISRGQHAYCGWLTQGRTTYAASASRNFYRWGPGEFTKYGWEH